MMAAALVTGALIPSVAHAEAPPSDYHVRRPALIFGGFFLLFPLWSFLPEPILPPRPTIHHVLTRSPFSRTSLESPSTTTTTTTTGRPSRRKARLPSPAPRCPPRRYLRIRRGTSHGIAAITSTSTSTSTTRRRRTGWRCRSGGRGCSCTGGRRRRRTR